MNKSPTILVTGASGFVGKNILNLLNGRAIGLQRSLTDRESTVYSCDLLNKDSVKDVTERLKDFHFTHLIHTAGVTPWSEDSQYSDDLILGGSVLYLCKNLNIPNLINLSGWNVYDMSEKAPFSESCPIQPVGEYGESKYKVEELLAKQADSIKVLNLRLASIYGPGQTSPGLIPNSVKSALSDKKIILKSLHTKRDYLYIDDLLGLVDEIVSSPEKSIEGVLNVGSGKSVSVIEIAEVIKEIIELEYSEAVTIETERVIEESKLFDNELNIDKAKGLHLLQSTHSIDKGLLNYIQWVRNENIL